VVLLSASAMLVASTGLAGADDIGRSAEKVLPALVESMKKS
jgi:hypothetical protein